MTLYQIISLFISAIILILLIYAFRLVYFSVIEKFKIFSDKLDKFLSLLSEEDDD